MVDGAGFVYAIRAENGLVKLGHTRNSVTKRVADIQRMSPVPLELLGSCWTDAVLDIERYFHRYFADKRINGEWFRLTTRDLALLLAFSRGNGETIEHEGKQQPVFYSPLGTRWVQVLY